MARIIYLSQIYNKKFLNESNKERAPSKMV